MNHREGSLLSQSSISTKVETRMPAGEASLSGTMTRLQCCRRAMPTAFMLARPCRHSS